MKIVIDISDKMFDTFKKHDIMTFDNLDEYDRDMIADAIANGTPLPKEHGRLIDADAYISEINRVFPCNDRDDTNIRRATEIGISGAPILIDADK